MRIIEKHEPKEIETEITCHKCKTKFAYVSSDIKSDRDGKYLNCPSCNAFISTQSLLGPSDH